MKKAIALATLLGSYVYAYVQFLHYAECLYLDATGAAGEHGAEAAGHGAEHEH